MRGAVSSTTKQNFEEEGFSAKTPAEEQKCPDFELDQLVEIRDVTNDVQDALAGKTGDEANKALARQARPNCSKLAEPIKALRCDVVSLYHGGIYDLYRYKRYNDVRLVFAPEFSAWRNSAAIPTISISRALISISAWFAPTKDDKPASSPDYLHWSANGTKDGDLVFVSGNPGWHQPRTDQFATGFERDLYFPQDPSETWRNIADS